MNTFTELKRVSTREFMSKTIVAIPGKCSKLLGEGLVPNETKACLIIYTVFRNKYIWFHNIILITLYIEKLSGLFAHVLFS